MSGSSSTSSQSYVPPGFRFHPTEEELLLYYLRKKVALEKIELDVIREIDINKLEPWEIQEKCKIGSTPQNDWYFFSHKDKKYPTGTRTNRATAAGFWKATGRDKVIHASYERIGMRKTLVFYMGRAPHGQKSDWIMHEYRLDDQADANAQPNAPSSMGESAQEDGWVVCRIFKKKNYHKTPDIPSDSPIQGDDQTQMGRSSSDGAFEQILECTEKTCKQETASNNIKYNIRNFSTVNSTDIRYSGTIERATGNGSLDTFMQMPHLKCSTLGNHQNDGQLLDDAYRRQNFYAAVDANALVPSTGVEAPQEINEGNIINQTAMGLTDWVMVDRFAASQLNGKTDTSSQLVACFSDPNFTFCSILDEDLSLASTLRPPSRSYCISQGSYENDTDLWPFQRST